MYKILRSILFLFSPEAAHYFSMSWLKWVLKIPFTKKFFSSQFSILHPQLEKNVFGLTFKNAVGLAAGFDKNAKYLTELEVLGLGFIEIGTVTPLPQKGNDRPRLFRLPKDKALINRMGFNNDGVEIIAKRLKKWKEGKEAHNYKTLPTNYKLIIGGNIGKNKYTPNEDAWKDFEICFKKLFDFVDYFVVNVSSPNTPGLRELQQKDSLEKILSHLKKHNDQQQIQKSILLKISPDLNKAEIDEIIDLALKIKLDGFIVANTTISRESLKTSDKKVQAIGSGGLSGKPLQKKSTELLQYISDKANNKIPIIASGGIFAGSDALEKMKAGASLVQVWTGLIYEGPGIVKKICRSFLNK